MGRDFFWLMCRFPPVGATLGKGVAAHLSLSYGG
jgi:hypothetical protein